MCIRNMKHHYIWLYSTLLTSIFAFFIPLLQTLIFLFSLPQNWTFTGALYNKSIRNNTQTPRLELVAFVPTLPGRKDSSFLTKQLCGLEAFLGDSRNGRLNKVFFRTSFICVYVCFYSLWLEPIKCHVRNSLFLFILSRPFLFLKIGDNFLLILICLFQLKDTQSSKRDIAKRFQIEFS